VKNDLPGCFFLINQFSTNVSSRWFNSVINIISLNCSNTLIFMALYDSAKEQRCTLKKPAYNIIIQNLFNSEQFSKAKSVFLDARSLGYFSPKFLGKNVWDFHGFSGAAAVLLLHNSHHVIRNAGFLTIVVGKGNNSSIKVKGSCDLKIKIIDYLKTTDFICRTDYYNRGRLHIST
jgi:pentatricopeptide repeat protein